MVHDGKSVQKTYRSSQALTGRTVSTRLTHSTPTALPFPFYMVEKKETNNVVSLAPSLVGKAHTPYTHIEKSRYDFAEYTDMMHEDQTPNATSIHNRGVAPLQQWGARVYVVPKRGMGERERERESSVAWVRNGWAKKGEEVGGVWWCMGMRASNGSHKGSKETERDGH